MHRFTKRRVVMSLVGLAGALFFYLNAHSFTEYTDSVHARLNSSSFMVMPRIIFQRVILASSTMYQRNATAGDGCKYDRGPSCSGALPSVISLKKPTTFIFISFEYDAARLGNKLFQYASTLGVAHRHSTSVLAVLNSPQKEEYYRLISSMFRLSVKSTTDNILNSAVLLSEPGFGMYDVQSENSSLFARNATFTGFLQSWRYFRSAEHIIRSEYQLTSEYEHLASELLHNTARSLAYNVSTFVGVHVRRGDMMSNSQDYSVASSSYLINAMHYFWNKNNAKRTTLYVVATDDEPWVKHVLSSNNEFDGHVIYTSSSPALDLAVLTKCNHSVITCGSFGWWGAWIAGGEVVYYSECIPPSSNLAAHFNSSDYYPPSWIGMT